ncbi:CDP-diacylglycerol--serine O-phosphatidyltransferase [Clostridium sp. 19966]|uniref:CDP-diacylglycerol--serine O-phosphatidyltransferase n=1 Tax=Clostridium sp. 19966 TaxID=2768166 RepID=UPI0028DFAAC3|nr:CDP-diacylglycerol--serine O-phosphatidyltransferase [Clostridium sp. 19966]MDT8718521.1 CDP-diacylglycerol--serine O-phosphatidyltransferase [Clostridium sp. 19966]
MIKKSIPNIFTLGNLACGLLSILASSGKCFYWAGILILLAGVMDRYDGRVARFLQVSSEIGKELDSLADLVSFGVAPAILIYSMYFEPLGPLGYILVLMFPIAGAYRLARYNCTSFDGVFMGIPITIAGTFMAFFALITIKNPSNFALPVILMVALSYLMVSKLRIKKV